MLKLKSESKWIIHETGLQKRDKRMKKTIGMFAHVDAGKTTLAEQLLYTTHTIQERGRVITRAHILIVMTLKKNGALPYLPIRPPCILTVPRII